MQYFWFKHRIWLLWLLLVTLPSFGEAANSLEKISVAYCEDCVPFQFQDENGQPAGMISDHWRLWEQKTGIKVDYQPAPWYETLNMVRDGTTDAHAGLFKNEERDTFLEYGIALHKSDSNFFHHKSIPHMEKVEEMRAYRVGVLTSDYHEQYLKQRLPKGSVVTYPTFKELMAALVRKDILVFVADMHSGVHYLKETEQTNDYTASKEHLINSNNWFVASKNGNSAIIEKINSGMAQITAQEDQQINERWGLLQGPTSMQLTKEEKKWIATHKIRVGVEEWAPYIFSDSPGHASGVGGDYLNRVLEKTGLKAEIVSDEWNTLLNGLREKSIDLLPLTYHTEERAKYGLYSKPFFYGREFIY